MSRWFEHDPSGRLKVREHGHVPAPFGLPFIAAGVFAGLVGLGAVTLANADEIPAAVQPILLLMGIVFGAVGASVAFGRQWTTIDTGERVIAVEAWAVIRLRAQVHRLDDHEVVVLGFEERDSDGADQFPVSLRSRDWRSVRLCGPTTYAEARECAVAIAQHTRLPLEDLTTEHPLRVSADEAALPLISRAILDKEPAVDPLRNARAEIAEVNDGLRIVVSTNGWLKSRRGWTAVQVSPAGVHVDERGFWRTKRKASFKASEIVDVDFGVQESMDRFAKGRGITIKATTGLEAVGAGLADDEIRYLHALIRRTLLKGAVRATRQPRM